MTLRRPSLASLIPTSPEGTKLSNAIASFWWLIQAVYRNHMEQTEGLCSVVLQVETDPFAVAALERDTTPAEDGIDGPVLLERS